jgi:hypothetical protein
MNIFFKALPRFQGPSQYNNRPQGRERRPRKSLSKMFQTLWEELTLLKFTQTLQNRKVISKLGFSMSGRKEGRFTSI